MEKTHARRKTRSRQSFIEIVSALSYFDGNWKDITYRCDNIGGTRHKVFISYHHDDQDEVEDFCRTFDNERDVCITRALGVGMDQEIIDSNDADYVMRRIRELYLKDSSVTILLIGKCTWARRYIDWEIQASLRHGDIVTPNGLIGIVLPSTVKKPIPPERFIKNVKGVNGDEGYARYYWYLE